MKFVRLWMAADPFSSKMNAEVEVEVAGINFSIKLSDEAKDIILRAVQPDITEGVKRLGREIGVEVGNA